MATATLEQTAAHNKSEALREVLQMCGHTSTRVWEGDLYTVGDCRFPQFDGMVILCSIQHGQAVFTATQ